jgi:hypothetical protein
MTQTLRIALIGDYNPSGTAHQAIPPSPELAARAAGVAATLARLGRKG